MYKLLLVLLFIITINPLRAEIKNVCSEYASKDHRKRWPKSSIRDQCGVGSCHSFAAIGLVEAAHSLKFDKYIDLSENDLFRQHMKQVNKGEKPSSQISDIANKALAGKDTDHIYQEGAQVESDIKLMKKNGVCFEKTRPYSEFNRNGKAYKALNCMNEEKEKIIGQALYCDKNNQYSVERLQLLCNDVMDAFRKYEVDEQFSKTPSNKCMEEREKVKAFMKSLKFKRKKLKDKMSFEDKKEKLLEYLTCQPVAVTVVGYSKIRKQVIHSSHDPGHALIIAGFDCTKNSFIMRNSWGGDYEVVDADLLAHGTYRFSTLSFKGSLPDRKGVCPDKKK